MKQILFIFALFMGGLCADALIIDENAPKDIIAQMDSGNPNATNQGAIQGVNPLNQASNQSAIQSAIQSNNSANPSNPNAIQSANNTNSTKPLSPQEQLEAKANKPTDPDERLKEDIVNFMREKHIENSALIDDPFVYVSADSEDALQKRARVEQALLNLKLKSIIIIPSDSGSKRYNALINDQWVEECKVIRGQNKICDEVNGWEVVGIEENVVKLRVAQFGLRSELKLIDKDAIDRRIKFDVETIKDNLK